MKYIKIFLAVFFLTIAISLGFAIVNFVSNFVAALGVAWDNKELLAQALLPSIEPYVPAFLIIVAVLIGIVGAIGYLYLQGGKRR